MNELVFGVALVSGLLLFTLILIAGIVASPRMGIPGWTMAVGSVFLLIGIVGLSGIILGEHTNALHFIDDDALWSFTFNCLTPASLLFTTGFVWDRIRFRRNSRRR